MLDPASDLVPPQSSPTISSVSSSSDLESAVNEFSLSISQFHDSDFQSFQFQSQSTGSFFHDRSTTLGTLMGVTFPPSFTFNALPPPGRRRERAPTPNIVADSDRLPKRRRRWWWGLCGDDLCCRSSGGVVGSSRRRSSASLAEFLEVERRLGEAFFGSGDDQLEEIVNDTRSPSRVFFEDGRVLPPATEIRDGVGAFRFPVSIGGLCNRGVG